jgi:hypothetical protein
MESQIQIRIGIKIKSIQRIHNTSCHIPNSVTVIWRTEPDFVALAECV